MSPKAAPGAAGLALIDDAWRDVDDSQLPGVLLAFPFYENVDMDELLGPLIARGIKVFADSGAFSAWRSGNSIDLDRYTAWLKKWSHLFNQYANLDVIGDAAGTAVNQAALEAEGLHPLPTLHYGVSWERFDEVIDKSPSYVAFGGMVGRMTYENKDVMRWCVHALSRTQEAKVNVHGYGVTRWEAIWNLPWHSVDSTTWQNGSRYGSLLLFTGDRLFQARATQLVDNLPAIRATGMTLHDAYDGINKKAPRNAALVALRSIVLAQSAVRRRHAKDDFTIYCAAIL